MARCSRCGTLFNYQKTEGVCPKCCFYNRENQTNSLDNEWTKNYDFNDNEFQLPKMEDNSRYDDGDRPKFFMKDWVKKLNFNRSSECNTEGSHVHRDNEINWKDKGLASVDKMKQKMARPEEPGEISGKTKKNIAIVIVVIYIVIIFLVEVMTSLF